MPPYTFALQRTIGLDLIYSFVITFASILIYRATKELYELTNHKGIKYFRLAFLFFALAYTFRFLAQFLFLALGAPRNFSLPLGIAGLALLILFLYASTAAILYLWASVHWKKFSKTKISSALLHTISIFIAITSIATQNLFLLLIIQAALIIALASTIYAKEKSTRQKKNRPQLYLIYILLAIFWILNILDVLIPNFFQLAQILIYLASISLFLVMLYKVLRKTGNS